MDAAQFTKLLSRATVTFAFTSWLLFVGSFFHSYYIELSSTFGPRGLRLLVETLADGMFFASLAFALCGLVTYVFAIVRSRITLSTGIAGVASGAIVLSVALILGMKLQTYGTL